MCDCNLNHNNDKSLKDIIGDVPYALHYKCDDSLNCYYNTIDTHNHQPPSISKNNNSSIGFYTLLAIFIIIVAIVIIMKKTNK